MFLAATADDDFGVAFVTFEVQGEVYTDDTAPYQAEHLVAACPGGAAISVVVTAEDSFGQRTQESTTASRLGWMSVTH